MDIAGYLLYLLAIYLPGFGLLELLDIEKKDRLLVEIVGYATGLGFAADAAVLFVGSSGLQIGNIPLLGVTINKFYILILLGIATLAFSAAWRRRLPSFPRPGRYDGIVFLVVLAQLTLLLFFFAKYPIFPEYESVDFRIHINIVQTLLNSGSSIPTGLLYYGVHYQLALGVLLTGDTPLIVIQRIGGILAILGTPLIFLTASRIFASKEAGLISSVIYSITASIWFSSLFNTGLFPNFFGILASLFLLALVTDCVRDGMRLGSIFGLMLAVGLLYLSHYSDVSVIPPILAVPVVLLLTKRFQTRSLIPPLLVVIPAVLVLAVVPDLLGVLTGFLANAGGNVIGGTYLSGLLAPVPVVAGMATVTYYDLGFIILVAFSLHYAVRSIREKDALKLLPLFWFLSILVVSPLNPGAWRLSYIGLVPLTMMAASGLSSLLPRPQQGTKRRGAGRRKTLVPLVLIVLIAGSWSATIVSDSLSNTALSSQAQQDDYSAIMWLGNYTRSGPCLSVSDFHFVYTTQLIHRDTFYQFISTPGGAIPLARASGVACILVTRLVTASVPLVPSLFPWNNFPTSSDDNLTLLYSNPNVRIYALA